MVAFADADKVYAQLGAFLREVVDDDELGARLRRVDTIFQYRLREPDAQLTVKALASEELEVALGETALAPEVVLSMPAEVAHRLWLGELNATVALARGDIVTRGPAAKVLGLVPVTSAAASRYRARHAPAGAEDAPAGGEDAPAGGEEAE